MACIYFLYSFVSKIKTAENPMTGITILDRYRQKCHGMADFLFNTVNSEEAREVIKDLKKLHLTDREFYMPKELRTNEEYLFDDIGRYCEDSPVEERKIFLNRALMEKIDVKVSEYVEWLNSETHMICGFDAFDLLYAALTFNLTNIANTIHTYSTIDLCDGRIKDVMEQVRPECSQAIVHNYFKRATANFHEIFYDWHKSLHKCSGNIKSIKEFNVEVARDEITACGSTQDHLNTLSDLLKHAQRLDLFGTCNSFIYMKLDKIKNGNNDKTFCIELTEVISILMRYGETCANLLAKETEKYLTTFYNPETKMVVAKGLRKFYDELERTIDLYHDTLRKCLYFYKVIFDNYNAKHTDDKVEHTDFQAKEKEVITEFVKILSLISKATDFEVWKKLKKFEVGFEAETPISENEPTTGNEYN